MISIPNLPMCHGLIKSNSVSFAPHFTPISIAYPACIIPFKHPHLLLFYSYPLAFQVFAHLVYNSKKLGIHFINQTLKYPQQKRNDYDPHTRSLSQENNWASHQNVDSTHQHRICRTRSLSPLKTLNIDGVIRDSQRT